MRDYRNKLQAIDTDKKAQAAIYAYWQDIAEQWTAHLTQAERTHHGPPQHHEGV